ncbi:MAG: hypothetical protein ABIR83_12940, partial [Nakamurella sp.]
DRVRYQVLCRNHHRSGDLGAAGSRPDRSWAVTSTDSQPSVLDGQLDRKELIGFDAVGGDDLQRVDL